MVTRPRELDLQVIERLRQVRVDGIELLVLFGSRASGRARPSSDLDVAVRVRNATSERKRRIEIELLRATGDRTDVIFLDEAPPQLRFEIARSGIPVIESEEGGWARERARAMIDWWDWAPIARRLHAAAVARLRREAPKC
jgi:predicted nucleotidyltransferase